MMKAASPALIALLSSANRFIMADLYTITLVGGSVLRYSAASTTIYANGYSFALGPKFERSKTKIVIGTQVDELEVSIYTEPNDLIGGVPFLQAAWQGQLDGALLQLERAFMPTYGDTSPGTVILFAGRISDIECTRTGIDLKCRSHLELLNIQMPRRLWQSSCTHTFGDAMCQFDRSSMQATFSAEPGSSEAQNRDVSQSNSSEPVYPRNRNRGDGGQCRIKPHGRQHGWRLGLCNAGISLAYPGGRPIPTGPRLRPHTFDLYECV
jgi:Uncharacterized conserved protein (DUF2163)